MLPPEEMRAQLAGSTEIEPVELLPLTVIEIDCADKRGNRYRGSFKYKVPTLGEQIEIGRLKATYLPAGADADLNARLLNEQICYLEVTLQQPRPEWYRPFALYDAAPISALYAEVLAYEKRFHGANADARANTDAPEADAENNDAGALAPTAAARTQVRDPAKRRQAVIVHGAGGD